MLPAKWRKQLPDELVVAISPDDGYPALTIYDSEGFGAWMQQVMDAKGGYAANNREMDDLMEEFYENAEPVSTDSAGRILITPEQRAYAHMDKEVVISGVGNHLVLRSLEIWESKRNRSDTAKVYDK
jgi:MraZ protein